MTSRQKACSLACRLFNAQHAYVQPHSGADANLVAYVAILSQRVQKPILEDIGETDPSAVPAEVWRRIRGGDPRTAAAGVGLLCRRASEPRLSPQCSLRCSSMRTPTESIRLTGLIDMDALERRARDVRPLILLAGYSACTPGNLTSARFFREIAMIRLVRC